MKSTQTEISAKQKIVAAYQGELYGISFFKYFLHHYEDSDAQYLWQKLIEVESLTAEKLALFLNAKLITFSRESKQQSLKGESDAKAWVTLEKQQLLATLSTWVMPYEVKYREWLHDAQTLNICADELNALKLIAAHETAIYLCLNSEKSGQSGIHYLEQFLTNNQ